SRTAGVAHLSLHDALPICGFSLDRTGVERVRAMARRGEVDLILAYAVDRLSRNQNQIGVLFDEASTAGVRLEFATENFEDTAMRSEEHTSELQSPDHLVCR